MNILIPFPISLLISERLDKSFHQLRQDIGFVLGSKFCYSLLDRRYLIVGYTRVTSQLPLIYLKTVNSHQGLMQ